MDYTTFCHELFQRVSSRLPLHLKTDNDFQTLARQGGWYYPSCREKDALYFDFQKAYSSFLTGMDMNIIADSMESSLLLHEWRKNCHKLHLLTEEIGSLQWGLHVRPLVKGDQLPEDGLFLCWSQYILVPCCRRPPALVYSHYHPDQDETEEIFWDRFWKELMHQDPPLLYAIQPHHELEEIDISSDNPTVLERPWDSSYILTSRKRQYGAAVIFYPGLLPRVHGILSDFFLLLTSPHEVMLFPGNSQYIRDALLAAMEDVKDGGRLPDVSFPPSLYQYTVGQGLCDCHS